MKPQPSPLQRLPRIHYAWVVVGVAFFLLLASAGVRSAPGVLIEPLEDDFNWSRGKISLALAVSLLALGFAGPVSGWVMGRIGMRRMAIAFLLVAIIGTALTAAMRNIVDLYIAWGLLVGFGTGGVSTVLSAAVANTWFESRRGLVTGILGGASSAGQFVLLFPLLWAESAWGWRGAVAGMAALLGLIVLPLAALLFRSRPADLGLAPYGTTAATLAAPADTRTTSLRQAIRVRDFWLLASSFFICGFTTVGLIGFHFIPHAGEHGFSKAEASGIVTLMGFMNIVGTLGSGWLTDRYSPRKLLAVYYFLRACSLLVLPFITTVPLMSLFAVVFGLDFIATVPPTVMLTANRFGRRSVPTLFGWITCSHMVGGAVAAAFAGQIHDVAGDYSIPIYVSGLLALLAAAIAFNIVPAPIRRAPEPAVA
ncbi:MAG: MFS transporter [Dehalococcoidia bacterium]